MPSTYKICALWQVLRIFVMSKEEIKQKIKELKAEQANCHGSKCEVYSRVVGYLRPVKN